MMIDVTIQLPEAMLRDARELGILEMQSLTQLLQEEIDRRVNALVNEEIHAYRNEKRRKKTVSSS